MKETLRIILASALITAAVIKAAPALAQSSTAPVRVSVVHTADLDLASVSGRQQLEKRLGHAARDVCGTASDADLSGKNDVRACRTKVLSQARLKAEQLVADRSGDRSIMVAAVR